MLSKFWGKRRGKSMPNLPEQRGARVEALEERRLLSMTGTGIDPANMGKGNWIWRVNAAAVNTGSETVEELAQFLENAGFKWIIVKAGDGDDGPLKNYGDGQALPRTGSWYQFNRELIDRFHAHNIKIFGYHFMYGGGSVSGRGTFSVPKLEQQVAKDILSLGPDGLEIGRAHV